MQAETNHKLYLVVFLGLSLIALAAFVLVDHWSSITLYIQQTQKDLHGELAAAIRAAQNDQGPAFLSLIVLSFLYGVFHAAGPGHGKMVIATYMVSHPAQLPRGIMISCLSSLAQGGTAIAAVGLGAWLLNWSARQINAAAGNLEVASFALVGLLGFYLAATAARRMLRRLRKHGPQTTSHCGHDHGHDHCHDGALHPTENWFQTLAMISSIGIRPCSGAILVLIFAFTLDIVWGGILAVLAMSVGTAITVSTLAVLAVTARSAATRLSDKLPGSSGAFSWFGDALAFTGGLVIVALGVTLVHAAIATQAHPLL